VTRWKHIFLAAILPALALPNGGPPKEWQRLYDKISATIVAKDVRAYMAELDKGFVNIKNGKRTSYSEYEKSFRDFLKPFSHIKAHAMASNYRKAGNEVRLDYHYTFSGEYRDKEGTPKILRFFEDGTDTWRKVNGHYLQVIEDVKKQGLLPAPKA